MYYYAMDILTVTQARTKLFYAIPQASADITGRYPGCQIIENVYALRMKTSGFDDKFD